MEPVKNRIFAIPDIHGRNDLLTALLDKLMPTIDLVGGDKIIVLGDMVDRGPDSRGVVATLKQNQEFWGAENFICLFGNHERMMLDAIGTREFKPRLSDLDPKELWAWNGGLQTLKSYHALKQEVGYGGYAIELTQELESHVKWISKLPLSHEEPGFFFSHAPVPRESWRLVMNRGQPFTEKELTWTYHADEFGVARDFGNGTIGVCGHIHRLRYGTKEPRFYDHYIFADAGCGCSDDAPLVAIEVRSREIFYSRPTPRFLEEA